jgi:tRNA U34 5-carboxymethylaminomethyl modifying GTPase MnmE/TrmE
MNIYALSSGRGPSGIAIIRLSGKDTQKISENISKNKDLKSKEINFCKFYDTLNNN